MEAKAAVEMFERSIEKRRLRYTLFVGDGDSSCFGSVKDAMKDIYNVEKEECVGHVSEEDGVILENFQKLTIKEKDWQMANQWEARGG